MGLLLRHPCGRSPAALILSLRDCSRTISAAVLLPRHRASRKPPAIKDSLTDLISTCKGDLQGTTRYFRRRRTLSLPPNCGACTRERRRSVPEPEPRRTHARQEADPALRHLAVARQRRPGRARQAAGRACCRRPATPSTGANRGPRSRGGRRSCAPAPTGCARTSCPPPTPPARACTSTAAASSWWQTAPSISSTTRTSRSTRLSRGGSRSGSLTHPAPASPISPTIPRATAWWPSPRRTRRRRASAHSLPRNSLVAIALGGGKRGRLTELAAGRDFYASAAPLAGRRAARVPGLGPAGHAVGQRRALRGAHPRRRQPGPAEAHRRRQRQRRLPAGVGAGRPPLLRLGRDRLGLPLPLGRRAHAPCGSGSARAELWRSQWVFGMRCFALAPDGQLRRASTASGACPS